MYLNKLKNIPGPQGDIHGIIWSIQQRGEEPKMCWLANPLLATLLAC